MDLPVDWLVTYNYTCERDLACTDFARTIAHLLPGLIAIIILCGGCLPIVYGSGLVGKKETSPKLILAGFVIIIVGLALLKPISDIIISTC
jgi:hypothetical protein